MRMLWRDQQTGEIGVPGEVVEVRDELAQQLVADGAAERTVEALPPRGGE